VLPALATLLIVLAGPQDPAVATPTEVQEMVGEVRFEGTTRLTEETLRLQVRTKPGAVYSPEVVNEDLKLLAARFQVWGRSHAERLPDGTLRIVFHLDDAESVRRIRFTGNRELREADLRAALGLSENNAPRDPLPPGSGPVALLVRKLEEKYQEEGHLYAEIDARVEREGEEWVLVFQILEGPEVAVDDIEFEGLRDFAPRHLRSLMSTSRSFWFFTQTYKPRELRDDVVKIEQFLHDEGYLDARVAVDSVTASEDGEEVDLVIRIEQGPRFTVRSLKFSGNEKFSSEELAPLVRLAPGMPYRQTIYRKDHARLLKQYRRLGYMRAEIDSRPVESARSADATVDLTIRIREGEPKRVRDVRVIGNRSTRDDVIRRELDLHPGELFSGDEMRLAEDRLRAAGFFTDERGQPLAWVEHEKTDDPRLEDVVMRVEDGTAGLFNLFGGISSGTGFFVGTDLLIENFDLFDLPSSPGATLEEFLDQRAFHGGGQKLRLRANPGNQFSNYYVQFVEPYLTGPIERPVFLDTNVHLYEYGSRYYDQSTTGFVVALGKRLSRNTSISLGYRQDRVDISDIEPRPDPIEDLLAVEGGNSVRGLISDWEWRRFDSLRNPTEGARLGLRAELLGGPFQSDVDALKTAVTGELLVPVWENEEEQRHVLSLKGSFVLADPYGDSREIPFYERYYAGGPGSLLQLRGFEFRGVGPHDGDFPVGGSAGWVMNTEYVFPLIDTYDARLRESIPFLRGVLFADHGMLEADWDELRDGTWRLSVGAGIRMKIPFQLLSAPLELYYGVPIRRASEDERESFQISFSTRF